MIIVKSLISQEVISTVGIDVSSQNYEITSYKAVTPSVVFGAQNYDEHFNLSGNFSTGRDMMFNMGLGYHHNKNWFGVLLNAGLSSIDYQFSVTQIDSLSFADTANKFKPQELWDDVSDNNGVLNYSQRIGYAHLGGEIFYNRTLFVKNNFSFSARVGLFFSQQYSFRNERYTKNFESLAFQPVKIIPGNVINLNNWALGSNVSADFRFGASIWSIGFSFVGNQYNSDSHFAEFNRSSSYLGYKRVIGVNKLALEQYIEDENSNISATKVKQYRKGDKSIYFKFSAEKNVFNFYSYPFTDTILINNNLDSISRNISGYEILPSVPLSASFNFFATNRWMMGFGLDFYRQQEVLRGTASKLTSPSDSTLIGVTYGSTDAINELYEASNVKNALGIAFYNSVYLSNHILVIDPFIHGSAAMITDPPALVAPLKSIDKWKSRDAFYPYFMIGAGADVRLRIRSSKYLILSLSADYLMHPHANYINAGLRLGYYWKKKTKR